MITIKELNNIKMYLDFLLHQIDIDSIENTEDQYDKNIWFFSDQYYKIFDVLDNALKEYSIDVESLIKDKYVLEGCTAMWKELDLCLKGEKGMRKIYIKNNERHKKISEILEKIREEIPIQIYSQSKNGLIYVMGDKKYLDLIKKHMNMHTDIKRSDISYVSGCYPDWTEDICEHWTEDKISDAWCVTPTCPNQILEIFTKDYVTVDYYVKKCFNDL